MDLRRARSDARLRVRVARPLLVVLAALALLGTGGGDSWDAPRADVARPPVAGPSSSTPVAADHAPPRALELRPALLAAVPAPLSAPDAAPPARTGVAVSLAAVGGPVHLAAALATGPPPGGGSRAPPGSAGTSVTLPTSA